MQQIDLVHGGIVTVVYRGIRAWLRMDMYGNLRTLCRWRPDRNSVPGCVQTGTKIDFFFFPCPEDIPSGAEMTG